MRRVARRAGKKEQMKRRIAGERRNGRKRELEERKKEDRKSLNGKEAL